MTAPIYTGYQQSNAYSATQDRYVVTGPMLRRATANPVSGVIPQGQSGLYATRSGFNVTVENGAALVSNYWFIANGNTTVAIDPVTGTARRDLVVARVYDTSAGDATSEGKLEVVKGTTTVDPTIPARSLVLWQVDVPASGTALVLTDRRIYTVAAGAVRPTIDLSSIVIADQMPGMPIYDLSTDTHWVRHRGDSSKLYRMGATTVASGIQINNENTDTHYGYVYRTFNGINLPTFANVVIVTASIEIDAVNSAIYDFKVAFDNVEIGGTVINSNGAGARSHTMTATVSNRAAGNHDLAWIGVYNGAGGPAYLKNAIYSWVALG